MFMSIHVPIFDNIILGKKKILSLPGQPYRPEMCLLIGLVIGGACAPGLMRRCQGQGSQELLGVLVPEGSLC